MVANMKGLAGFTKRNRRNCEIFYARHEKTLGQRFQLKPWPQSFVTLPGKYNKQAGNQIARDFFWFYFSFIFLCNQSGATFILIHNSWGKSLAPGCYDSPKVLYMWLLLIQIQTARSLLFFFAKLLHAKPKHASGEKRGCKPEKKKIRDC